MERGAFAYWWGFTSNHYPARDLIPMDPITLHYFHLDDPPWAWIWAMQFVAMAAVCA